MFGSKKKEPEFKFDLGAKVKDTVTGFTGIITSRTQWIHNCNVYGLQPTALKDGEVRKRDHFDEPQLTLVEPEVIKPQRLTGGPTDTVRRTTRWYYD